MTQHNPLKPRIEITTGDITRLAVDAIVNAANSSLLGGGGVDGAIHRAAGPELLVECRDLGGCPTGKACITDGYNLPACKVIHTVGPVWQGGTNNEASLLASCYRCCLELAVANSIKSIAFPAISTGIYGYPIEQATTIALQTTLDGVNRFPDDGFESIIFVCFDGHSREVYETCMSQLRISAH